MSRSLSARIIAVTNCKGGTGKSTTAVNVAAEMAAIGRKVLVVDLDPQGHAGFGLGIEAPKAPEETVHQLFRQPGIDLTPLVRASAVPGIDVLPADPDFRSHNGCEHPGRLANALAPLRSCYDTVVIDTPPAIELPLLAALDAAESCLVPTQLQHLAEAGLRQFSRLFFTVAATSNPHLQGFAIVPIQVDMRTHMQRHVLAQLLRDFGGPRIFRGIRSDIALAEAFGSCTPVRNHKPSSRGAEDYMLLARDVSVFWAM